MVKLTYYDWGDVMIQELLEKHKEKMFGESRVYRIRRNVYRELIEVFSQEPMMCGPFQQYLAMLEQDRQRHYQRHYDWGLALGRGEKMEVDKACEELPEVKALQQAKEAMEHAARWDGEETYALWKLFCRLEHYCRTYEAAYLAAQGVEAGEQNQKTASSPNREDAVFR